MKTQGYKKPPPSSLSSNNYKVFKEWRISTQKDTGLHRKITGVHSFPTFKSKKYNILTNAATNRDVDTVCGPVIVVWFGAVQAYKPCLQACNLL